MKLGKLNILWGSLCLLAVLLAGKGLPSDTDIIFVRQGAACLGKMHFHTQECFQGTNMICGYRAYPVHTHADLCYDGTGNLRCDLPQVSLCHAEDMQENLARVTIQQWEHVHSPECFEDNRMHTENWFGEVNLSGSDIAGIGLMTGALVLAQYAKRWERTLPEKENSLPQM